MRRATKHHDLQQAAQKVWGKALKLLGNGVQSAHGLHTALDPILGAQALDAFVALAGAPVDDLGEAVDGWFSPEERRDQGMYFTPEIHAEDMATWLDAGPGWVVDPAAGAGALLVAAAQRGHDVWGIELNLVAAVAAAVLLRRFDVKAWVVWGDGLDPANWPEHVKAVLANPPYVGEKGRKAFFRGLKERYPDLLPALAARGDLAYAFWLRSLKSGAAQTVFLVSEYWLWADSAAGLRAEMTRRLPVRDLVRLGGGRFDSAPGHHSMLVVNQGHEGDARFRETSESFARETLEHTSFEPWVVDESGARAQNGAELVGPTVGELLVDHQGFVSGLDRGNPNGFLVHNEVEGLHLRPVLRASACVPNRIFKQVPQGNWVVWVDEAVGAQHEAALAAWFGPEGGARLGSRREAALGRMPWYRLHWPRRRKDMVEPKLVVPRRSPKPAFCLDLSGAAISSDCTYLVAPAGVDEPLAYLIAMMIMLNDASIEAQLQASGKRKGSMFEFYATPLQRLRVPVEPQSFQSEVEEVIARLMEPDLDWIDVK